MEYFESFYKTPTVLKGLNQYTLARNTETVTLAVESIRTTNSRKNVHLHTHVWNNKAAFYSHQKTEFGKYTKIYMEILRLILIGMVPIFEPQNGGDISVDTFPQSLYFMLGQDKSVNQGPGRQWIKDGVF